ncbi:acyl-CoA synthetase FdrA [candidate division KSB1 bacterium]|nr:MAG: acyl-CoA synthetase FdrA [candidate division KSB1 bacterium]
MNVKGIIKKGEYYDSVTLMMAARKLNELPGVLDSAVVMGTRENRNILAASGLMLDIFESAADADLIIAVKAEDESRADQALAEVNTVLKSVRKHADSGSAPLPRNMDSALKILPEANIALISVAGRYAGDVAMNALHRGLNVMLFSDNVPLEQEIALKQYAVEHDLLVMGPDCGTAIINGVPLAFANVVKRGNIGIVAAAGTGLQEVSCLISNAGAGISQAIGTGGRDIKKEVGGLMFIETLRRLAADMQTKVILLVSKPPHPSVLEKITVEMRDIRKPVIAVFLGADSTALKKYGMIPALSLAEAASLAVSYSRGQDPKGISDSLSQQKDKLVATARLESDRLYSTQKYIRGLFSGGTFCYEAQVLLQEYIADIYSNAPTGKSQKLKDSLHSERHTLIDLGEDEFTVGRPHPMIDYSLRNKRIIEEAQNPETAVILLDIVLGFGSHPDPLSEIVPAIRRAQDIAAQNQRHLPVVCSVTGTDRDPQNRSTVVCGLREIGVHVLESNAAACLLAGFIISSRKPK